MEWQSQYNTVKMSNLEFVRDEKEIKDRLAGERRSFQAREEKKFR